MCVIALWSVVPIDGGRTRLENSFPVLSPLVFSHHPLAFTLLHDSSYYFSPQSGEKGYDPNRSRVSDDTMMDFIRGTVTNDVTSVPGIGQAAAKKLAAGEGDESITNTYQLIGKVRTSPRETGRGSLLFAGSLSCCSACLCSRPTMTIFLRTVLLIAAFSLSLFPCPLFKVSNAQGSRNRRTQGGLH